MPKNQQTQLVQELHREYVILRLASAFSMAGPSTAPDGRQSPITASFESALTSSTSENALDDPCYYTNNPKSLVSTSKIHSFNTGTGSTLYRSLAPLLESTAHELILVTCFWARSKSLNIFNDVLLRLSEKAVHRGTEKIKVRLCFSSLSILQKLFHSPSVTGQTYKSSVWVKKLGLLDPSKLCGLDIQIKSVFLLPFSVMHPKFMIIDGEKVVLPSCNISWEEWFEGYITMSGPIVDQFQQFYSHFWKRKVPLDASGISIPQPANKYPGTTDFGHAHTSTNFPYSSKPGAVLDVGAADIPTVFLPSPHRRNPRFAPFTPTDRVLAPPTPLNTFILTILEKAEKSIRIQTPNLTSPPVLSAILKALARGVDVKIVTSEKLMVLEQIVTAGTTTSKSVIKLIKRYKAISRPNPSRPATDEEAALSSVTPGHLEISYFEPAQGPKPRGKEEGEPQQSHLKMTIIDEEVLVLGSGNLDRASWFTSQELGVAFFDRKLAVSVQGGVDLSMIGRTRVTFDSRNSV
ncbi:phospholipase D/nuclease [Amniculicola lignicola CBS 123094]|uniref:Phospholipase D/nuclease n=1 Tax=Amniculicola lignicola CBS 123094 TaxID=1392246 RepID=A0A6A5VXC8_9PLEO|nr:phospholipase D/nuclease [Amniculicola lignicola CBS 123094]